MSGHRLVILESPYAGKTPADVEVHVIYGRACLRDSLTRGEAPFASHLLYAQPGVLNDRRAPDRNKGIDAGLAWGRVAEATVVYADHGITPGMMVGISAARDAGRKIEVRHILGRPE